MDLMDLEVKRLYLIIVKPLLGTYKKHLSPKCSISFLPNFSDPHKTLCCEFKSLAQVIIIAHLDHINNFLTYLFATRFIKLNSLLISS